LVTDGSNLYWTNWTTNGSVMRAPLDSVPPDGSGAGDTPVTLVPNVNKPMALAVHGGSVYYTTTPSSGNGTIQRVGFGQALATGQLNPEAIAVDDTGVYWTNWGTSGSVMKTGHEPGSPVVVLASNQNQPYSLTLHGGNVYWVNNGTGSLMKVGINGGTPVFMTSSAPGIINLAVDDSGAYFTTINGAASSVGRVGLEGGGQWEALGDGANLHMPYLTALDTAYVYFAANDRTIRKVPRYAAVGRVSIQAPSGHFVSAQWGGGIGGAPAHALQTDRTAIGAWELFDLIPVGVRTNKYALRTINGHFVGAVAGGGMSGAGEALHSDRTAFLPWEEFTLVPQPDNKWALQTLNGNYVTAVNGGGSSDPPWAFPFQTSATVIGPWEVFTILSQ
jgi:hypothetical protein